MKLSIITINLNNKEGLKKTIQSVRSQSFKNYEFIIIDGESTDGSIDLIKEYSNNINYWVSEKDTGIYEAMNKGTNVAKGEYCNFMNSGDIFYDSNVLESVFKKNHYHDIIIGKAKTNHRIIYPPKNPSFLFFFNIQPLNHQAAFIKKQLLNKYPYDETNYKIVSDWKFFIDAFIADNCSFLPINEFIVKFDDQGIGSIDPEKNLIEQKKVLNSFTHPRILEDYEKFKYLDNRFIKLILPMIKFIENFGKYLNPAKYLKRLKKIIHTKN